MGPEPVTATKRATHSSKVRRFFQPSYRQVTVVLVTAMMLAGGVIGLNLANLTAAQQPLDRVDPRLLAASAQLQNTARGLAATSSTFEKALALPPAERSVAAAGIASASSQYQGAFASYRAIAAGLPGEQALQQRFQELTTTSGQLSVALLGVPEVSGAQFAQSASMAIDTQGTLVALQDLYDARIAQDVHRASGGLATTRSQLLATAGIAMLIVLVGSVLILRRLRRDARAVESQSYRSELETRLHRALEMAGDEQDVFGLVREAVATAEPDLGVEMLVADSSRAHLHQVASSNLSASAGCPVASPTECPAAIHGQSQIFEDSNALDACPYLKQNSGPPCSVVCIPVSIAGRAMGVMHATFEDLAAPSTQSVTTLELIARRAGERLSMLRAFARSEMQAKTDPLTGLLNRRSLEASAQDLVDTGESYVAAYADLDHFKTLNDVHGHDAGDRALRLFARVLRDSVRPSDIPARYGGEEFVVVLPNCGPGDAAVVMERVRSTLAKAIADGAGPEFTVSVGVAESSISSSFSETVEAADNALLQAKATGRDRIVVAGSPAGVVPDDPSSITEDDGLAATPSA